MGYATEAAQAMVRAGFEPGPDPHRLHVRCWERRVRARAGKSRSPMRATLERHKYAQGRWWTSFLYEILREDHPAMHGS